MGLRPGMDHVVRSHGIRRFPRLVDCHELVRCKEGPSCKGTPCPIPKCLQLASVVPILIPSQQGATLYTIQLALNLIWMPLFFSLKRPIAATVDTVALTGVTGYLTYIWGQVDEVAAWSLAPYLGWLSFATYLSAGCGYLNNWDFESKERPIADKPKDTKFVDEKKE